MSQSSSRIEVQQVVELGFHNRHTRRRALRYLLKIPEALQLTPGPAPRRLVEVLGSLLPALDATQLRFEGERLPLSELLTGRRMGFAWVTAALATMLQRDSYPAVVNFGSDRAEPGTAVFYFEYQDITLGRFCGATAIQLAAILLQPFREDQLVDGEVALRGVLADHRVRSGSANINQNLRAILEKADARGIPWKRIARDMPFVQLGQGCKLHRFRETISDEEGAVATEVQKSKILCNRILDAAGLPTPRTTFAPNADQAVRAAEAIGYPVVLKPNFLGKGAGVFIGLENESEMRAAFEQAARIGGAVIVESYIPGDDHRLLVADGKFVAAARRIPARVIGDGQNSVRRLVEAANRDPRRGKGYIGLMNEIVIDSESLRILSRAGLTLDSAPAEGQVVELKRTANISSGGTAIDVTDKIHPDNVAMAERTARVVGLRLAGVDFLTLDISRSHFDAGGAICEVNAAVGLRPHLVANPMRDVASPILATVYPEGESGRIPIAAVTGTTGKTTTTRMLAGILGGAGLTVGSVTTDEVRVGDDILAYGDLAGISGAEMVLGDIRCQAAVLETARGGIIQRGLAFDRCDVAALTNIGEDHLGEHGVESPEQMARHKARLLRTAEKAVVLNANDTLCMAQREGLRAERIVLAAPEGANAETERHLESGGDVLLLEANRTGALQLVLRRGNERTRILAVKELPATLGGVAIHNAKNALFAAAMALAMGQSLDVIRAGLRSFMPDLTSSPGRLSLIEGPGFDLLIDFAHNAAQLETLAGVVDGLPVAGRRICLLTVPGNRLDTHIVASGGAAAGHFDHYICYEREDWWRGRKAGDIAGMMARGLRGAGVPEDAIEVGLLQEAAVARAVQLAQPGDLVAVFGSASVVSVPQFERASAAKRGAGKTPRRQPA